MEDKNYYINEKIGDSGIANTRNPIYSTTEYDPFSISGRSINVGNIITPTSKYDETIGSLDPVIYGETTVEDLRARQQSGLARMGNALVNNVVIAGTTAISGTLGLVDGIFSALGEGNIQKIWDNDVNNWVTNVQERTREALPIYRGQEYEDKSLVQKLGSGIFWADLVQSLGFAEGMLIPGVGMSKILSSAPKLVRSLVPSLTASIGEASIEAINSKADEKSYKLRIANDEYNRKVQSANSQFALGVLDSEYNNTLDSIEYDVNTAGNFVFGSNVALLTLSNAIQFGNLFSRGFGTSKRLKGALKRTGNTYSTDNLGLALLGTGAKKILDATSEGIEEVAQGIISNTPSNFTDYNTFNSSMFNPEKRELVANLWQAMGESYSQALGDSETGVEFATGFIIGALGIPTIRKGKFPIGIENNIGVELYDKYKEVKKQQELADNINSRLQEDKKINSYYNGLVRHLAIQDRMNIALDADDMFDYKNAESAQFISDIMMFDDAGDIDNLKNIINNSIDTSDAGIDTIIEETSKDGKGPFMLNGNALSREDVRYILNEKIGALNSKIDNYVKDKESLESTYPNMDNETLSNALFLKEQFRDHFSRYNNLLGEIHQGTNKLLSSLPQESSSKKREKIKKGEGMYITTPEGKRKLIRKSDVAYYNDDGTMVMKEETPDSIEKPSVSKNALPLLLKDPSYIQDINALLENDSSLMTYDERQTLKTNIQDLLKLETSLNTLNKELKEILSNSTKSAEDLNKNKEDAIKADISKKSKSLKERLTSARDLSEFREALNSEEDSNIKDETLKNLENEGNQLVKDYKEVNNYNKEVQKAINKLDEPHNVKMDALKLFQEQFNNSNNLSEIANPNSVFIDDDGILHDDTLTDDENIKKFQEAQYALLRAMNKVNNDNKFKDRFSQSYRVLKQKGNPVPNAPKNDTTGDSGTATIPPVNESSLPVITYETSVGNTTATQVSDENKKLNGRVTTQDDLDAKQQGRRPYYRPAIPELHIEASKDGDFRPFDVVVMEREGLNFSEIYNYLRDSGAFKYVNEGNLKVGDELGFMIDPEFESIVEGQSWHTKPTIFIIDTRNNQVVGSLDESEYSVNKYDGLKELRDRIISEYENKNKKTISNKVDRYKITKTGDSPNLLRAIEALRKSNRDLYEKIPHRVFDLLYGGLGQRVSGASDTIDILYPNEYEELKSLLKDTPLLDRLVEFFTPISDNNIIESPSSEKFIATPTTRVSQVMVGRIPYSNTERSLSEIPNVSSSERKPIFGIIKNGVLTTNGKIDDSLIIKPVDMAQKEGRMYLLIPNAAGKYSPAAVRVKHFNRSEFNPEDITIQSTTVFNNIKEAINAFANSFNEEDLNEAVKLLKQYIYTGNLHIDWFTSDVGNGIRFTKVQRDAQGNEIYETKNGQRVRKETTRIVFLNDKSNEKIINEVTNTLLDFNLPIQVNIGMLNKGGYNSMLINSGVLTSNITDARVVSSWFTTDYFDKDGNLQKAINPGSLAINTKRGTSPVGGNEGVIPGTPILIGNDHYYVNLVNNTVSDTKGNVRSLNESDNLLVDLAWAQDNFGDATQSSMMVDNKVWTPSGRVLDRSTQKYLEGEEAQKIIDQLSNTGVSSTTGAFKAIEAEGDIYEYDDEFEGDLDLGSLRRVDIERPTWNQEKELAWIKKVLPQLSDNDRVRVVKGLIKVANSGAYAWGQFNNGIITLSDIAAEGTTYHEAFHAVFNLLLDPKEKQSLLDEARKIYGEKDNISLEEDMAEGFREYVMSRDSRGLGRKILDFFKELLAKITNWKYLKPSLYSYYRMINEGKYTKESLRDSNITNLREEEYSQEMQSIKDQAIANNTFMKAPNGKHTNLTERQWLQVRTKAFKEWFGDWENNPNESSKVVDGNGEPLVVYHGSEKQFNTFDFREVSNLEGGFYFTSDKKYAENYGTIMYPVFLYIKNPAYNDSINRDVVRDIVITDAQNKYKNSMYNPYDGIIGKDTITGEFKYISKGKEYVIIKSPNQIKSATDNTGTFSRYNNNIRYRKIPNTSFETIDSSTKELLVKKGWTQEKFDSISQQERDYATRCASI